MSLLFSTGVFAQRYPQPTALLFNVTGLDSIATLELPEMSLTAMTAEDIEREAQGLAPRFAIPYPVSVAARQSGTWEALENDYMLWRLRIQAEGAKSINLGFSEYFMPEGGQLYIYSADGKQKLRPFTSRDNKKHGQLWTPLLKTDDLVIEITIPTPSVDHLHLHLTSINRGYRGFGSLNGEKSGSCNVDVVCPAADPWQDQIRSVAVFSLGGSTFCTGVLVNNTALDGKPFFLTANHCNVGVGQAPSLVTYWNYQNSTCRPVNGAASGATGDGTLDQFISGATLRAASVPTDMTLLELDTAPINVNAYYAGWNRDGNDAVQSVAIHHPSTDEKRISFEDDPTQTTSYFGFSSPGDSTHIRIIDWDLGTTEPGSSGSPLFDQNKRVIGQLHGGNAACGNNLSDWYGRLSESWEGGGTAATRLKDWLDPLNSGVSAIDGLAIENNFNNHFANLFLISGASGSTSGSNIGANLEVGEPKHADVGESSVWWEWVAPAAGNATFDTFGSNYDSVLAVYIGNAVDTLALVGANDDSNGTLQSALSFNTNNGASYKIAVAGYDGDSGDIKLNWSHECVLILSNAVLTGIEQHQTCSIVLGPDLFIKAPADVELIASDTILFQDGFSISEGAGLTARIEPF